MAQHYRSRGFVPGGFLVSPDRECTEMAALPPFLRTLLVTDGTVTKSLEAYFWEPVAVENLGQAVEPLEQDTPWLGLERGAEVLHRRVRLVGGESGTVYAHAESMIRLTRLPEPLRGELGQGRIGIGELLRECGLETYRELLDFGTRPVASLAHVFTRPGETLVYRTYRIAVGHQPAILITEHFPLSVYRDRTGG